jgi:diguanylate cyclase (GGDEF)-like protein/PAS domain S-box-containing protein
VAAALLAILVKPRLRTWSRGQAVEADLKAIKALVGTVYCLVGKDGVIRSVTPNARQVLGDDACDLSPESGITLAELFQPDARDPLDAWFAAAWLPEPPSGILVPARGADGDARWLELNTPGRLALGDSETIVVEVREVTARAEREQRMSLLAAALDASTDAVYITDADGRFEYVNASFERLTGYREEDLIGQSVSILSSGRHRPDFFAGMWDTLNRGEAFAGEVINRRTDGTIYTLDLVITPMRDAGSSTPRYLAVGRDITDRKLVEGALEDLAYYDALTGLANQRLLKERSRQILALARRHGSIAAMLHVDLDRLRSVNLQHGRVMGDDVLRTIAERLRQGLRESDTLARVGSDEFLVLLSEVSDEENVARVVRRLHDSVTKPIRIGEHSLTVNARIGVALYPEDAGTFDEILACAEAALRRAEQAGSSFEFFERDLSAASHDRLMLEDDLHWAWEHDQFVLHYQPIVGADGRVVGAEALARGEVVGVEALARWPHLERGMIGPSQFIPLAERTGRILSLDRWAIATAARQASQWLERGWEGWISVNLSVRTLHDPDLPDYMARTIAAHGLGEGRLVVEITESTAMRDPGLTARVLQALRDIGVLIAVDDFGVGHSSLSYLKLFPVDLLKLDASFVRDIGDSGRDEHLVEMMISLAHRIGAKVVAEGVEEEHQMEWLRAAGCDFIQGYLVGRPAPPEDVPQNSTGSNDTVVVATPRATLPEPVSTTPDARTAD